MSSWRQARRLGLAHAYVHQSSALLAAGDDCSTQAAPVGAQQGADAPGQLGRSHSLAASCCSQWPRVPDTSRLTRLGQLVVLPQDAGRGPLRLQLGREMAANCALPSPAAAGQRELLPSWAAPQRAVLKEHTVPDVLSHSTTGANSTGAGSSTASKGSQSGQASLPGLGAVRQAQLQQGLTDE